MLEYLSAFEKLAHGVLLYNPAYDNTFFVMWFVGGLRDDIRAALMLHRPHDVDTVSALALIQEQELELGHAKSSGQDFTRSTMRSSLGSDKTRPTNAIKPVIKTHKTKAEDKLASLKSFRRRNGLCFKCGEKWNPAHTCPPHISLHVLEEFLDALDIVQKNVDDESEDESAAEEQEVLAVQTKLNTQPTNRQTLKLLAQIGKHKVLVLVDSGSIGTFVSE